MIGDWQDCIPCTSNCKKFRAVKCIRPVGHGEQEADVIPDGYCQGPKPKESESAVCRERRESAPQALLSGVPARGIEVKVEEKPLRNNVVASDTNGDETPRHSLTAVSNVFSPSGLSKHFKQINDDRPKMTNSLNLPKLSNRIDKRTDDDSDDKSTKVKNIKKGQVIVDKEDIKNLTLTIILDRDDNNDITNFPKDFKPQPSDNETEFTLFGMDAVKYIQRIQEEARMTSDIPLSWSVYLFLNKRRTVIAELFRYKLQEM